MKFTYRPKGVCSQLMEIEIEDGRVTGFQGMGGCILSGVVRYDKV